MININILTKLTNLKLKLLSEEPNYTPRDLIDHHDSIGAIIKNNSNQILLLDHVKFNFWTIPIGKVEHGQTPEEGLKQELLEELGIQVINFKLVDKQDRVYIRNNTNIHIREHLFEVLNYKGIPENLEPLKHRNMKWFNLKDIKKINNTSNMTQIMLNIYN